MNPFLIKIVKSFCGVIVIDLLLLIYCLLLGSYFHILHSFTWFGFKIIVLPFSLLAFIISIVYFSKKIEIEVSEEIDELEEIKIEQSTRMEKYHQAEKN
ncbi:hypothetical protein V7148_18485 [Gottfriedia acidiceleris]|uniref:hypothetical protein n=1 Tax=Bacillaceae TaxID=186817 RepID=UPI000BEBFE0D|nr:MULTISPECIES: hypothetical protein [unclassified Bacillus (in: firmicutes)]PEC48742.1 hypothetical protein CON00_14260 [Bacillus sp. AFS096315]PFM82761.1 hypothetical protein COJ46_02830 [Bacillus sp. AFS077874]